MEDNMLLKLLKRSDEKALNLTIKKYTGYVSAVIFNHLGSFYNIGIAEEITADVFFAMWQNRLNIFQLKAWLGTTARNKAKSYLRALPAPVEIMEEDSIICSDDNLFDSLEKDEQNKVIKDALSEINPQESEIIIRYYYYNQTIKKAAEEMNINLETAKSRLRRSRKKLRDILEKGGYFS